MSESALVELARNGNQAAFAQLVEKYQSMVFAIGYSYVGQFEPAEDIAQEAFLSAWLNLGALRDSTRFSPWLRVTTRNHAVRYARNLRKTHGQRSTMEELPDPAESPAQLAEKAEKAQMIWQAVHTLPVRYREVVVLYYQEEKDAAQVARILGIREVTVRQRLVRARKMLRLNLEPLVEQGLQKARPGKAFTAAIIAALPLASSNVFASTTLTAAGSASAGATFNIALAGGIMGAILSLMLSGWLMFGIFLFTTIGIIISKPVWFSDNRIRQRLVAFLNLSVGILCTIILVRSGGVENSILLVISLLTLALGIAGFLPLMFPSSQRARRVSAWATDTLVPEEPFFLWKRLRRDTFPQDWRRVARNLAACSLLFVAMSYWFLAMEERPPLPFIAMPVLMAFSFAVHCVRVLVFAAKLPNREQPQ